ncbi:MAG: hypothetical protein ACHP7N_07380 [Caulobacterales bacterium]
MSSRLALSAFVGLAAALLLAPIAAGQDDPQAWSATAARGAFDLCRADAPDADRVAEHGEVWGWPTFIPYLEHPKGYKRLSGGESRRTYSVGDKSAYVELTVQSGQVTSAGPANIRYFRCNVAADQVIGADLEAYFTANYGPPTSKTGVTTVWLSAKPSDAVGPDAAASDDLVLKPVVAAGVGAQVMRIELTRERGLDRAKLTILRNEPAA